MLFQFFKKKTEIDPIVGEQLEQTLVRQEQDFDAIRDRMEREYESAVGAIEDYRKGYLSDMQLHLRFSDEEVNMIKEEAAKRNEDDKSATPGSGL